MHVEFVDSLRIKLIDGQFIQKGSIPDPGTAGMQADPILLSCLSSNSSIFHELQFKLSGRRRFVHLRKARISLDGSREEVLVEGRLDFDVGGRGGADGVGDTIGAMQMADDQRRTTVFDLIFHRVLKRDGHHRTSANDLYSH